MRQLWGSSRVTWYPGPALRAGRGSPTAAPLPPHPAGAAPGGRSRCRARSPAAGLAPRRRPCSLAGGAAASQPGGGKGAAPGAGGRVVATEAGGNRGPGSAGGGGTRGWRSCHFPWPSALPGGSEGGRRRRRRRRRREGRGREGRGRWPSRSELRRSAANTHTPPAAAAALLLGSGQGGRRGKARRGRGGRRSRQGEEVRGEGSAERGKASPPPGGETTSHVTGDRGRSWRSETVREAFQASYLIPEERREEGTAVITDHNHYSRSLIA